MYLLVIIPSPPSAPDPCEEDPTEERSTPPPEQEEKEDVEEDEIEKEESEDYEEGTEGMRKNWSQKKILQRIERKNSPAVARTNRVRQMKKNKESSSNSRYL
jgi:hypothetical protein